MPSRFATEVLAREVPRSARTDLALPRREQFHPSPADWRVFKTAALHSLRTAEGGA